MNAKKRVAGDLCNDLGSRSVIEAVPIENRIVTTTATP